MHFLFFPLHEFPQLRIMSPLLPLEISQFETTNARWCDASSLQACVFPSFVMIFLKRAGTSSRRSRARILVDDRAGFCSFDLFGSSFSLCLCGSHTDISEQVTLPSGATVLHRVSRVGSGGSTYSRDFSFCLVFVSKVVDIRYESEGVLAGGMEERQMYIRWWRL